jgi:DNA polymerase (family 10)
MGLRHPTSQDSAAAYAGGLDEARVRSQWGEIARIQEAIPEVRLLRGIEVDILEDGALDLSDRLLSELDVVIASVHVRHGQDQAAMTARVLRALDHPCTDVLGHPTGRLLQKREPSPLDMPVVLERAARRGVLLEVNGNPDRLDLSRNTSARPPGRRLAGGVGRCAPRTRSTTSATRSHRPRRKSTS